MARTWLAGELSDMSLADWFSVCFSNAWVSSGLRFSFHVKHFSSVDVDVPDESVLTEALRKRPWVCQDRTRPERERSRA